LEMGGSHKLLAWAGLKSSIHLISASQVARIIGLSHGFPQSSLKGGPSVPGCKMPFPEPIIVVRGTGCYAMIGQTGVTCPPSLIAAVPQNDMIRIL
jgi:hypothetical protein